MRHQLVIAQLLAVVGILIAFAIVRFPPPVNQPPLVQFIRVKNERLRMDARSQGRVMAKTEDLVVGVSGNIIKLSPRFISGGFLRKSIYP
ncbi:MAG: hypothetical protein H0V39_01230 [Nitrosomonas sp.]|nr:hypothetical protein [Nitrosomonas sp.]